MYAVLSNSVCSLYTRHSLTLNLALFLNLYLLTHNSKFLRRYGQSVVTVECYKKPDIV